MEEQVTQTEKEAGARDKILSAARKVFADKGFHGGSVNDVAQLAGVNKALLFYYFGSKRKLYDEVLMGIFERSARIFNEALKNVTDTEERLKLIISAYIRHFSENQDVTIMIMREIIGLGPGILESLKEIKAKSQRPLIETIQEGVRQGIFRDVDPYFTCDALFGIIHTFFHHPPGISRQLTNEDLLENIMDLLKNGLFCRSER